MKLSKIKDRIGTMVLAGSLAVASSAFAQEGGGQGGRGGMTGGGMPGAQAAPNETGQAYGAQSTGEAVFQFDPETDSLIVIADDETNDKIREVIERLDRPAPQVLINVVFLEVTHSDGLDLGLEGSVEVDGRSGDNNDYTLSDFWGLAAETQGAFFRVLEDDFTMTIRAYAEKSKLEILSRPSILARNNQEAVITVGQEVPFIRDSRITNDGQTINTIEYEDIGIILRVTPYVGENGVVEMHLLPEISSLTGDSVQISETVNAPVFAKRSAETRVIVPDGRTVAIGGLMEDSYIESVRKIPLLGDIPWLGALFRRTIKEKAKTELIIFLTPQVVPQTDLLDAATRDEIKRGELSRKSFSDEQFQRYSLPMDQDVPEDTEE